MKQLVKVYFYVMASLIMVLAQGTISCTRGDNGTAFGEKNLENIIKKIPHPPLDNLEKVVMLQLKKGREDMEALLQNPELDNANRALAYGNLGHLYHTYEFNDAAEACYYNAAMLNPGLFRWNYCLAYIMQERGDYKNALKYYKLARSFQVAANLKYLVNIRIGDCYKNLNQIERAGYAYELAYEIFSEGATVIARMGEVALIKKQYQEAIKYLTMALEKVPEANSLHYHVAMAYRHSGEMKLARAHLAKRGKVRIQPPDPLVDKLKSLKKGYRIFILNGKSALGAKRYEEALAAFQQAVEADPNGASARINLGVTYVYLNQIGKGLQSLEKGLELDPSNLTAHYNIGNISLYQGNPKKAIQHLEIYISKKPDDAMAHQKLASAYRADNQHENAFAHYLEVLKLDKTIEWAWIDLSTLLTNGDYHHEALQILEEAHTTLPHNKEISHQLARSLVMVPDMKLRNIKRALDLALPLFKEKPDYTIAKTIAMAFAQSDRCDKAVGWIEKSIDLAKKKSQPEFVLQRLHRNHEYLRTNNPCKIPGP